MSFVGRIGRFFHARILYSRISKLAYSGDLVAAISTLKRLMILYGCAEPNINAPVIANLLYADLSKFLNDKKNSYKCCELVLDQLGRIKISDLKITKCDSLYLKYKCKWIISELTEYSDSEAFRVALDVGVTYDMLNISKTSPLIVSLFPISKSDGFEIDTYFAQNR
jgi:hypothetical protein